MSQRGPALRGREPSSAADRPLGTSVGALGWAADGSRRLRPRGCPGPGVVLRHGPRPFS